MSTLTTFLGMELLELGELPGAWGTVLNTSFQAIDDYLSSVTTAQASAPDGNGDPADPDFVDVGAGTQWYDTAVNLLKIKSTGNTWVPAAYHVHGTTEGIPYLSLSADIDTGTILPSANVQYTGLAAEYLGSGGASYKWDQYIRLAANGLVKVGQQVELDTVPGLVAGEYNLVTLDTRGRATSAVKTTSSATLGLVDVLTIAAAAANYYNKTQIDSTFGFSGILNGGSDTIQSWADVRFGAKSFEHAEIHEHDSVYAKMDGYSGGTPTRQQFAVADVNTDIGTDGDFAMPKAQLDARYLLKTVAQNITGEVKYLAAAYYDPTNQITGSGGNPADYEFANKIYIQGLIATLNATFATYSTIVASDAAYHPKGGDVAQTMLVQDPSATAAGAVPLSRLTSDVAIAVSNHATAGHSQYDSIVVPVVDQSVNDRNCLLEAPVDASGVQNWYTVSGLVMKVAIPAANPNGLFSPKIEASCSDGFGGLPGSRDVLMSIDGGWNWAVTTNDVEGINKLTFPANETGFFGLQKDQDTKDNSWFIVAGKDPDVDSPFTYDQEGEPAAPSAGETWFSVVHQQLFEWADDIIPASFGWQPRAMVSIGSFSSDGTTVTITPGRMRFEKANRPPYDIAGFIAGNPVTSALVFKFASSRIFTPRTNHFSHCGTNPSAQTDFDVQVNGVSKSTIRVATNGTITFIDNGFNNKSLAQGDRIEIISPANVNGIADISFTFEGEV